MTNDERFCKASQKLAKEYVDRNSSTLGFPNLTESEREHMYNMIHSALQTKYKFGYSGGSFIKAVVNNDLLDAMMRADSTNLKLLPLIVFGLNSIDFKEILTESDKV